jgi:predicted oxidoreductase (fatty acid repression mutant protein)
MSEFWDVIKTRRTNYRIGRNATVNGIWLEQLLKDTVTYSPAAFNAQTSRVVALLGAEHDKFWDIVWEALKAKAKPEHLTKTKDKLDGFKAGLGTILLYRDETQVKTLQESFPSYADNFIPWAEQGLGGLQYILWSSLDNAGFGVSLQHYNPVVDAAVAETWDIPTDWTLRGQLVFGSREAAPAAKVLVEANDKVRIVGLE